MGIRDGCGPGEGGVDPSSALRRFPSASVPSQLGRLKSLPRVSWTSTTSDTTTLSGTCSRMFTAASTLSADNGLTATDKRLMSADKGPLAVDNGVMSVDPGLMATDKRLTATDKRPMATDKRLMSADKWLMATDKWLMSRDKAPMHTHAS